MQGILENIFLIPILNLKMLIQQTFRACLEFVKEKGYELVNADCTIIAQRPKMAPYIEQMRARIAELLEAALEQINVKATTTEKLGFTGREEGIAAQAVVLLQKN